MQRLMSDIFTEIKNTRSKKKKMELLRAYDTNPTFKEFCAYVVNPHLKWMLPKGKPPFKEGEVWDSEGVLWAEVRRMYMFVDCIQSAGTTNNKREELFIGMLETLHPDDAQLLIDIKDGNRIGITEKLIKETWPELLTYE